MKKSPEQLLCLHAAIIMFLAFFAGLMIGLVATGQAEGNFADWRLAHVEPLINSILMLAVAGCMGKLALSDKQALVITYCLIIMGYCNSVFGLMRGFTGALGYEFTSDLANNITAFAGMLGVPMGIIAFGLIILGAIKHTKN